MKRKLVLEDLNEYYECKGCGRPDPKYDFPIKQIHVENHRIVCFAGLSGWPGQITNLNKCGDTCPISGVTTARERHKSDLGRGNIAEVVTRR